MTDDNIAVERVRAYVEANDMCCDSERVNDGVFGEVPTIGDLRGVMAHHAAAWGLVESLAVQMRAEKAEARVADLESALKRLGALNQLKTARARREQEIEG